MKLKIDGTPKKSGGKRTGSYQQPTKTPPAHLPSWPEQLQRALRIAANNNYRLPKGKFFSKAEVKQLYGKKAYEEFSKYFKSLKRFDSDRADEVRQKQAMGLFIVPPKSWPQKSLGHYTPEKYANWLVKNKCFAWQSILKDEFWRDVYEEFADHGRIE